MNSRCLLLALFLSVAGLALAAPSLAQTTWYVDDDNCPGPGTGTLEDPFCRIQDGINESSDGDTVLVMDGFYSGDGNHTLDFGGRAILLTSENGPENCIIDGAGPVSGGIGFVNGEGLDSVLRGFTIQNFFVEFGAGTISCIDTSPTIEGNIIQDNASSTNGGGIHCTNSNPAIHSNTIHNNYGFFGGGAIWCSSSSPSIDNNTISENVCDLGGGAGIYCENSSSPSIVNNKIRGNYSYSSGYGGGIHCRSNSSPLIMNNEIDGNKSSTDSKYPGEGGGIYCLDSSPVIIGNLIVNNEAVSFEIDGPAPINPCFGGGIACRGVSAPAIVNNIIAGNTLTGVDLNDGYGGGIYCGENTSPLIMNNTIVGNHRNGDIRMHGGGIYCDLSSAEIVNCIVWDNYPNGIEGCEGLVTYCDVQGGYDGDGNIDRDPLFITGPEGCSYLSQMATGQAVDSRCVDRGSGPAATTCVTWDSGTLCMDELATRMDQTNDSGIVDIGYHHGNGLFVPCPSTVSADLACTPSSGTIPFSVMIDAMMTNHSGWWHRRFAGRLELELAGGQHIATYKQGYTNIGPGMVEYFNWSQILPYSWLVGTHMATFFVEDVTPSPYNQPPFPPAGDTATVSCTVTAYTP